MVKQLSRQRQRGDVLLYTLLATTVLVLGFLYAMRTAVIDTMMSGNLLTHQKEVQVSDLALRWMENTIASSYAGQALELGSQANNWAWYRKVAPGATPPTDAANPGYWKSCLGNTTASLRCASISLPSAAGYTALALVQPTGHTDASQCPIPGAVPRYYDVFIHISEVSGLTSATTETIYKLCVAPSSST